MVPFFIPASILRDSLVLAFPTHRILGSGGVPKEGNDERPKESRGASGERIKQLAITAPQMLDS